MVIHFEIFFSVCILEKLEPLQLLVCDYFPEASRDNMVSGTDKEMEKMLLGSDGPGLIGPLCSA